MRCKCHDHLFLTAAQDKTLDLLAAWVIKYAATTTNLASQLANGGKEARTVANQINYQFNLIYRPSGPARGQKARPPGFEKFSALALACHYACLEYKPGMLRSTSYADDLNAILRLYDDGLPLHERALKTSSHPDRKRLFNRAKRRAGGSWGAVFAALNRIRPDLDAARFSKKREV